MTAVLPPVSFHRFIAGETLMALLFNGVLNAVVVAVMTYGRSEIPLFGLQGMALDLVPTVFFTAAATVVVATPLFIRRLPRVMVPALQWQQLPWPLVCLPANLYARGIILGVAGLILIVPLTILCFHLLGAYSLPVSSWLLFKTCLGAILGALVTPLVILTTVARRPS